MPLFQSNNVILPLTACKEQGSLETSPLIYSANQLTGFCITEASFIKELTPYKEKGILGPYQASVMEAFSVNNFLMVNDIFIYWDIPC